MPSRQLHSARWGLIPSWAKEVSTTPLINARIESVLDKPSFQESALSKRCAIPADGYFEWQSTAPDSKVPFFIYPSEGMLAFAGIYSWWRNPAKAADDPARWVLTASLLTKESAPELAQIHNRNPVMLSEENLSAAEVLAALSDESDQVAAALEYHAVSSAVGSVQNNSAELIARVS